MRESLGLEDKMRESLGLDDKMRESLGKKRVITSNKQFLETIRLMIGDNIRSLRNDRGLTQTDLSKLLGLNKQQISFYETGKVLPSLYVVMAIAKVLQCRIMEIYTPYALEEVMEELDLNEIRSLN